MMGLLRKAIPMDEKSEELFKQLAAGLLSKSIETEETK